MSKPKYIFENNHSFFKTERVDEYYEIGELLGTGNFAEVRLGLKKATGEKVAIKIIKRDKEGKNEIAIKNEINILWKVNDHPNVIQLQEIYEDEKKMYLIMELVTGGELFDRIVEKSHYDEASARNVITVVIRIVAHMHAHGIVHRDLKPENILYKSQSDESAIKIADFGLAKLYQPADWASSPLTTVCGTPGYVAPEVLRSENGYTPQCDMWSVGVLLYILLCGFPPFYHEHQEKMFRMILRADYEFTPPYWDDVSDDAKDMVSKLLVLDPEERMSPNQALSHPWMLVTNNIPSRDIENLDAYMSKFIKRKFRVLTTVITAARLLQTS